MLANVWRFDNSGQPQRFDGGRRLGGADRSEPNVFVWRHGRDEVRLRPDGDGWSVAYLAVGKLLGPRQVLYEARHKRATHAAWDVMARVIRASRDEEEGVRVAQSAARWMRGVGIHEVED
jgi:hypothetical protein